MVTGKVRFSYVSIFQPRAMEPGDDPKYSISLLIPKTDIATLKKIKASVDTAKQQGVSKWGGKMPPDATLKLPLRDGDMEKPDDDAYQGCYFLTARSSTKPGIVDSNLNEIIDSTAVYSGCYGKADINFYPYSYGSKGIACGLNNIQKLSDGENLGGGRARPEEVFEAEEEENPWA